MTAVVRIVAITAIVACVVATLVDAAGGFASGGLTSFNGALSAMFIVTGWLLTERRRGNAVGPLLLTFGAFYAFYLPADLYVRLPGEPAGAVFAALFISMLDAPMFVLVGLVLILFPDGRLPSARWWPVPWIAVGSVGQTVVGATLDGSPMPLYPAYRSPLSVPGFPGLTLVYGAYGLMILLLAFGAMALAVRWRRGDPVARTQIKWVVAAAFVLFAVEVVNVSTFDAARPNALTTILTSAAIGLLPVAISIAVLRYRLFDIDRIVSRTIAYGLVTGVLGLAYVAIILALQAVLAPFTNEQTVAVAGSTLAVFALFQPVRRRVQGAVDRRFDRARYDADLTVGSFAARLRGDIDLGTVRAEIIDTATAAVRPTNAGLWLRGWGSRNASATESASPR